MGRGRKWDDVPVEVQWVQDGDSTRGAGKDKGQREADPGTGGYGERGEAECSM